MSSNFINDLINLSNSLDSLGSYDYANFVDSLIHKFAAKHMLSPEDKEDCVRLYFDKEKPLSTYQIARIFDVSDQTVARAIKELGYSLSRGKLTPEQKKKCVELYFDKEDPQNTYEIADIFGVSRKTVSRAIKELGYQPGTVTTKNL